MIDLSAEAAALEAALGPAFGAGGGRVVQFVSAQRGEGTSTVAREFARHLAQRARKGVWLIELDLMRGDQYQALAADPERYGFLGKAAKASPDESIFFQVVPALPVPVITQCRRFMEGEVSLRYASFTSSRVAGTSLMIWEGSGPTPR